MLLLGELLGLGVGAHQRWSPIGALGIGRLPSSCTRSSASGGAGCTSSSADSVDDSARRSISSIDGGPCWRTSAPSPGPGAGLRRRDDRGHLAAAGGRDGWVLRRQPVEERLRLAVQRVGEDLLGIAEHQRVRQDLLLRVERGEPRDEAALQRHQSDDRGEGTERDLEQRQRDRHVVRRGGPTQVADRHRGGERPAEQAEQGDHDDVAAAVTRDVGAGRAVERGSPRWRRRSRRSTAGCRSGWPGR